MAAELGLAVASFGHLEHMLKHAIFALERDRLAGAITAKEFESWLARMDAVAADSLGTLIERLDSDLRRMGLDDPELLTTLAEIRAWRNLLCHAVWQPVPTGWQPLFSDTRGDVFKDTVDVDALVAIRETTLHAARRIGRMIEAVHGNGDVNAGD